MRLPDPERSQLLLIGASKYADKDLLNVPAVDTTISDLADCLTDPDYGVVRPSNCAVLVNEGDLRKLGRQLRSAAEKAEDLLLVYYTGHGLLSGKRKELYLALPDSESAAPEFNSLEYGKVRDAVLDSPAHTKVIILDCCFSGRGITGVMAESATEIIGQIEVDGTYILTSAPQHGLALFLPGEKHTAFTGRLLRILDEGIPGGPELLTIDDIYQVLRASMKAEGLPEPQKCSTRTAHLLALAKNGSRASFHRALKLALRSNTATREQVLRFLYEQETEEVERWLHASDMTSEIRERALSLVLSQMDKAAADVMVSRWSAVGDDVMQLITRKLHNGSTLLATWCLDTVSKVSRSGGDRLLAELLIGTESIQWQQVMAAQIKLLQGRDVPARNTFNYTCATLRSDDSNAWGPYLVRELLSSEMRMDGANRRVEKWMDWICRSNSTTPRKRPDWVIALNYVIASHANEKVPRNSSPVMLDDAWVITILQLALTLGCLPQVLEHLAPSIMDLALRATALGGSSSPSAAGSGNGLLSTLKINLWDQNVLSPVIATMDVVRVLLGGRPSDLPDDSTSVTMIDSYGEALRNILTDARFEPPLQNKLQGKIFAWSIRRRSPSSAAWLLNQWSEDRQLLPHLIDFLAELPEGRFPYSEQLSPSFWAAIAQDDRLIGPVSVEQVINATREAALNPAVLQRTVDRNGLSSTRLAVACYASLQAGVPVTAIIRAMGMVVQQLGKSEKQAIEPRVLDNVLREFQMLSSFESGDEVLLLGDNVIKRASIIELRKCYDQIIDGAFGKNYGSVFATYLDDRLRNDIRQLEHDINLKRQMLSAAVSRRRRRLSDLIFPRKYDHEDPD